MSNIVFTEKEFRLFAMSEIVALKARCDALKGAYLNLLKDLRPEDVDHAIGALKAVFQTQKSVHFYAIPQVDEALQQHIRDQLGL